MRSQQATIPPAVVCGQYLHVKPGDVVSSLDIGPPFHRDWFTRNPHGKLVVDSVRDRAHALLGPVIVVRVVSTGHAADHAQTGFERDSDNLIEVHSQMRIGIAGTPGSYPPIACYCGPMSAFQALLYSSPSDSCLIMNQVRSSMPVDPFFKVES